MMVVVAWDDGGELGGSLPRWVRKSCRGPVTPPLSATFVRQLSNIQIGFNHFTTDFFGYRAIYPSIHIIYLTI